MIFQRTIIDRLQRIKDVVLLDFGDPDYVVPYNPLDVQTSGLTPEKATQMIVDIGKSLWTTSWGPRMQIPIQRSVLSIAAHIYHLLNHYSLIW